MPKTAKKPKTAKRSGTVPGTRGTVEQPPPAFTVPGRRTSLTEALGREIADKVANCASFKDACLLSGVVYDTGLGWLEKGRLGVKANGDTPDIYVQFYQQIEGANGRRRTLLKLQMRRAASGTATRPGDWRAAQALGAMSDPGEFVPQIRVHVEQQLDGVLDALAAAFQDDPVNHAKALQAVVSRGGKGSSVQEDTAPPPQVGSAHGQGRADGEGEVEAPEPGGQASVPGE